MVTIVVQLFFVITAIGIFQSGFTHGWLVRMPGSKINDHAHLIILCLCPIFERWLSSITFVLWSAGIWAYIDDFHQHYRRANGDPDYTSFLHNFGWYTLRIGKLRDFLTKNVSDHFKDF